MSQVRVLYRPLSQVAGLRKEAQDSAKLVVLVPRQGNLASRFLSLRLGAAPDSARLFYQLELPLLQCDSPRLTDRKRSPAVRSRWPLERGVEIDFINRLLGHLPEGPEFPAADEYFGAF